jgi:hypothetical protein
VTLHCGVCCSLQRLHSFTELLRGVYATLRTHDGAHTLTGEMSWRDVMPRRHPTVPYAHAASLSVMSESRPSLKASLRHTYTAEGRDDPFMPTVGPYMQVGAASCCCFVCFANLIVAAAVAAAVIDCALCAVQIHDCLRTTRISTCTHSLHLMQRRNTADRW